MHQMQGTAELRQNDGDMLMMLQMQTHRLVMRLTLDVGQ